jgi:uncharacterized HAD superfamily protein
MTKSTIVCDLDGCLNYYPNTFLQWVKSHYGIYKEDICSLKNFLSPTEYKILKNEYRTCGVKRTLAVREGAVDALRKIRRLGKQIWISTSRPDFEPVRGDTEFWLRTNKIVHDRLTFLSKDELKNNIIELSEEIWFVVEDEYHVAIYLAEQLGLPVFLFGEQQKDKELPELVTKVTSWHEIILLLNYISPLVALK